VENESNPYQAPRAPVDSLIDESANVRQVMMGQKLVIYSILVNLAAMLLQGLTGAPGFPVGLAALVFSIYAVLRLAGGLGMRLWSKVLLTVLMFVPLINLVTLLIVNTRATRLLRDAGYRVGLLGASR
jgi:hypothetical protein